MSPVYLNPPPSSPIPFLELKGGQNTLHILGQRHDQFNSTTTSDETLAFEYPRHPQEIKVDNSNEIGQVFQSSSWAQSFSDGYATNQNKITTTTSSSNDQKYSKKWKPSKVRIMQKMMATSKNNNMVEQHKLHLERQQSNIYKNDNSHDDDDDNNNNKNGIRVCTDCHTTTTPLWRSGPHGPKSLCNACGIRQRKARRAAMAAAEAAGFAKEEGVAPMAIDSPKVKAFPQDQEIMGESSGFIDNKICHPLPLKKRGKIVEAARNYNNNSSSDNHHQNNRLMSSSNKDYMMGTSQRGFPRDEEEGAMLLMALSCGLAFSS